MRGGVMGDDGVLSREIKEGQKKERGPTRCLPCPGHASLPRVSSGGHETAPRLALSGLLKSSKEYGKMAERLRRVTQAKLPTLSRAQRILITEMWRGFKSHSCQSFCPRECFLR